MRRAASGNASSADARRAADRLRQATDALGGLQQQDTSGKLGQMASAAEQLANEQKKQADGVRDIMSQQQAAQAAGRQFKPPTAQDIDKMVEDRQKVSDELSHLQQQMRNTARELASTQPGATSKLRSALQGLDENDLGTRLQRSSDQLRQGYFSDQSESALTGDLQKLSRQLGEAAHGVGAAQPGNDTTALNRAMDDLSRLRDQLDRMGGNRQAGQQGQGNKPGQGGQQRAQGGELGQQGQQGGGQQGGGRQGGQGGQMGDRAGGQVGDRTAGNGGNRNSTAYGDFDTGNTHIQGHAVTPQQGPNPADAQRDIDQGLNTLNGIRGAVQDSPEAKQELQKLIDQMRNLDPKRFPGNPALVEQMHQQLVSQIDQLELQLRKQADAAAGGTIRNTDPTKVPAGYQASVAEYYRRLSAGGKQ